MLVLTRKQNERIVIGTDIVVTVLSIDRDHVRLGFEAPRSVTVHRQEVFDDILRSNREALLESKDRSAVLHGIASHRPVARRS